MVMVDGYPQFIAKDACNMLRIVNNRDAVSRLDYDEKGIVKSDTLGGLQKMLASEQEQPIRKVCISRKSSRVVTLMVANTRKIKIKMKRMEIKMSKLIPVEYQIKGF